MTVDQILTALWALGWFVTLALVAAVTFAARDKLLPKGRDTSEDSMAPLGVMLGVVLLGLAWPAVLALLIGWFLQPFAKKALERREAAKE